MVRGRQSKAGERRFGAGLNEWLHPIEGEEAGWNRASCREKLQPRASITGMDSSLDVVVETSGEFFCGVLSPANTVFCEEETTHDTERGQKRVH